VEIKKTKPDTKVEIPNIGFQKLPDATVRGFQSSETAIYNSFTFYSNTKEPRPVPWTGMYTYHS